MQIDNRINNSWKTDKIKNFFFGFNKNLVSKVWFGRVLVVLNTDT